MPGALSLIRSTSTCHPVPRFRQFNNVAPLLSGLAVFAAAKSANPEERVGRMPSVMFYDIREKLHAALRRRI
jgi:hypothetical protein